MFGETHTEPHVPQLPLSVIRFVHVPAQSVYGAEQPHVPPSHRRLPPHVAPQKPQFVLLVDRFAQMLPPPPPPSNPPPPAHSVVGDTH